MESNFSYTVREKALTEIAETAARTVEGAEKVRCRRLLVEKETLHLQLSFQARCGIRLQLLAQQVQAAVYQALSAMTCREQIEIAVTIEDIIEETKGEKSEQT